MEQIIQRRKYQRIEFGNRVSIVEELKQHLYFATLMTSFRANAGLTSRRQGSTRWMYDMVRVPHMA